MKLAIAALATLLAFSLLWVGLGLVPVIGIGAILFVLWLAWDVLRRPTGTPQMEAKVSMNNSPQRVAIGWLLACVASWAALVGVFTFFLLAVYGGSGSGDTGTLVIFGFVLLGWPTFALGTAFAYLLAANRRRGAPRWGPAATGAGLVVFGVACMIVGAIYYLPAALFWIGLPTLVAVALTAAAARRNQDPGRGA